jgi:ubiquinone/menaquinone biosynthesis C-methylase UbiE
VNKSSRQDKRKHLDSVREQFTKRVESFSGSAALTNAEALRLLLEAAQPTAADTVLDVACGPGIVACAFAEKVSQVAGIDLTPAMIEKAKALQGEKGLSNIAWKIGDIEPLPFGDYAFSIVVNRLTFHHLLNPSGVFNEMVRVCRPGGRVVLSDLFTSEEPAAAELFNREEKLRDPSHTRVLRLSELKGFFARRDLGEVDTRVYRQPFELEALLEHSAPPPEKAAEIRRIFQEDIAKNALGIDAHLEDGKIHFAFSIAILAARKR